MLVLLLSPETLKVPTNPKRKYFSTRHVRAGSFFVFYPLPPPPLLILSHEHVFLDLRMRHDLFHGTLHTH